MTLRQQVVSMSLLGTAQPKPFEPTGTPLDPLLNQLQSLNPAPRLLQAIALLTIYEESGAVPTLSSQTLTPANPDPRPLCPPRAASHLASILAAEPELLPEWLHLLNHANQRPPAEFVPTLLDLATKNSNLRPAVSQATGPLGPWLAQFRTHCGWLQPPSVDEADWQQGTPQQRLALLRHLRAHHPQRAFELIHATWSSEPADFKRQILDTLKPQLAPTDEPFLETCLDDRSLVVRRLAAELLTALPSTQLSQRLAAQLSERIALKSGQLHVEPFHELTPALIRDGIEKKPTGTRLGERAWWTMQALAAVDPHLWTQRFDKTPAQLLEAAQTSEWSTLLLDGWRSAALRRRDSAWLQAFLAIAPNPHGTFELFAALPSDLRESVATTRLTQDLHAWIFTLPTICNHRWSKPFTEFIFNQLAHLPLQDRTAFITKHLLRSSALLASPDVAATITLAALLDQASLFEFRQAMHQAFTPENP